MQNISISTIPKDVTLYYLDYLNDRNINNVRSVSTHFKQIVDDSYLYKYNGRELKLMFSECISIKMQMHEKISNEKEINKKNNKKFIHNFGLISKKEKGDIIKTRLEFKNNTDDYNKLKLKHIELTNEFSSLKTYYDERIALDKIMNLFGGRKKYEKLPLLDKAETMKVETLNCTPTAPIMRGIDITGKHFIIIQDSQYSLRKFFQYNPRCSWYTELNFQYLYVIKKLEVTGKFKELAELIQLHYHKRQEAFEKIMGLFGGKEGYEALPILEVLVGESSVDEIDLNKISAPIMRGKDDLGRNFFAILVMGHDHGNYYKTFFEKPWHPSSWVTYGQCVCGIADTGWAYIIEEGIVNEKNFKELADMISNTKEKL